MKNSLQLQLQIRIRKANKYLISRHYQKAIQQYSNTIQNYLENRRYNSSVSEHFESILYALRANAYSLNLQSEPAQQDFYKSLALNPYSSVTLAKRARHYIKLKKLEEAIQDIDTALLQDPTNISLIALLDSIKEDSKQFTDKQEQSHISQLIIQAKKHLAVKQQDKILTSSQSDEDEEQFLKFSKLKKIDRLSIKVNVLKIPKRQSIVQFKEDQIVQYQQNPTQQNGSKLLQAQNIDKILKDQDVQLKQLQQQQQKVSEQKPEQNLIIIKIHQKGRKSILRRDSVFNDGSSNQFLSFTSPGNKTDLSNQNFNVLKSNSSEQNKSASSFSRLSVKNIDGKFISHQPQKIKFQNSCSSFGYISNKNFKQGDQNNQDSQKVGLTLTQPKLQKRKSCFKVSKRFSIDELDQLCKTMPARKTSNFLNIKSIDGQFHKKSQLKDQQQEAIQIKISSDSDDENQHDIFGHKKDKQLIKLISSVNGKVNKHVCLKQDEINGRSNQKPLQLNKKKSILKKDSFSDSPFQGWKSQKKKSVLFKTG